MIEAMEQPKLRLIGGIAAFIVVAGILLISSQYLSDLAGGASADVVNYDNLPAQMTITADQYKEAIGYLDAYSARNDLATKNEIIQDLREHLFSWAN